MRALLIAALLAGCGTDESPEDIANRVNADRTSCNGEWGVLTDCATVCVPKPAMASVDGCGAYVREVDGVMGYCDGVDTERVFWIPCEGQ